ncbi:hypothetical protein F2Q68_00035974 [Brassica cretica]|uniref:Uncharacterized protein n=1 Tax=Brassica cretica TaxID=69181 RepID=A0A8S9H5K6_BRACR|nr:hypothetical protein F2Q68_00035974 [Brassica cretica]
MSELSLFCWGTCFEGIISPPITVAWPDEADYTACVLTRYALHHQRRHIEFTFWYSSRVSFLALLLDVLLLWCSGAVAAASVETVRSHLLVSARSACLKAITLAHFGLS